MPHNPFCIFFFACSGSGKSTVRRSLVSELKATYICNDEIRELLQKYPEAVEQGIELKTIAANTVEKIFKEAPNKFIVFDNNIVQYYMHDDSYLSVARAHNRPVFIIGLESSEKELVKRIKDRGVNVAQILGGLPAQLHDYKKATRDIKPDWTISDTDEKTKLYKMIKYLQVIS